MEEIKLQDNINDKKQPSNLEAEQALIGSILVNNDIIDEVSTIINPTSFYDPAHTKIYEVIETLNNKGMIANPITLKNYFEKDNMLNEVGGTEYLVKLTRFSSSTKQAVDYAKVIHEMYLRRELILISDNLSTETLNSKDQSAEKIIETTEKSLFDLAERGSFSQSFLKFNQALDQTIEMATLAMKNDRGIVGVPTGLTDLDEKLGGLHKSDLVILAGRPSMGKTSLATNIAFNIAKKFRRERDENGIEKTADGGVVGFFSLEMSSEQLATRLLAEQSGVPSHKIRRGDITPDQFEHVRDSADEISRLPLHIDDTGGISIGALAARARRLKRMVGLDMVVVDYLQLLTGGNAINSSTNRVQEVSMITQGLKALAKELDIPVLALAQLSRQVEQRDDKRPQLSDLRESGSIEQDTDVVMFVFREEYYVARSEPSEGTEEHLKWQEEMEQLHGKAEVIIGKQRHGPIGTVKLSFNPDLTKFGNLAQDDRYDGMGS